jgi:hypothetical protein
MKIDLRELGYEDGRWMFGIRAVELSKSAIRYYLIYENEDQ